MNLETCESVLDLIQSTKDERDFDYLDQVTNKVRLEMLKAAMNRYLHEWSKVESSGETTEGLCNALEKVRDCLPMLTYVPGLFAFVRENPLYAPAIKTIEYEDGDGVKQGKSWELPNVIFLACKRYVEIYRQCENPLDSKELRELAKDLNKLTDHYAHDWELEWYAYE